MAGAKAKAKAKPKAAPKVAESGLLMQPANLERAVLSNLPEFAELGRANAFQSLDGVHEPTDRVSTIFAERCAACVLPACAVGGIPCGGQACNLFAESLEAEEKVRSQPAPSHSEKVAFVTSLSPRK